MDWVKLIKDNENKIKKAMQKAHWDSLNNTHLRYVLNMNKDGDIWTMEDLAGGNSFSGAVFDGTAIELISYCYEFFDGNAPLEQKAYKESCLNEDFDRIVDEIERGERYCGVHGKA